MFDSSLKPRTPPAAALAVWLCLLVCPLAANATEPMAKPSDNPPVAGETPQQRMVRLAERYAEPPASETVEEPVGPADAEVTPRVPVGTDAATSSRSASRQRDALPGGGSAGGTSWLFNTLMALGVVVGLILLLKWAAAKFGLTTPATPATGSAAGAVEVVSRTGIGPKSRVLLLRVGGDDGATTGRVLVVGEGPAGLQTLAEVTEPEEVASLLARAEAAKPQSITGNFANLLHRFTHDAQPDDQNPAATRGDRARDSVSALLARIRTGPRGGAA